MANGSERHRASALAAAVASLAGLAAVLAPVTAAADAPGTISVVDGATAPVFDYTAAIRERVYIPVLGVDQDLDGITDVTAIDIIRPAESDGALRVPAIIDPSPYFTTIGRSNESEVLADSDGDGVNDRWPLYYDNYFVPRGYAVVLAQPNGTGFSTGCPMHGGPGDIASMTAVIDWLQGRLPGYDAVSGGNAVVAHWHSGRAAMIGKSYDGTLANGVAATGVEGLTTIVPITAISNWYAYSRTGGARHDSDYPASLASTVTNPGRRTLCGPMRTSMSNADGDGHGDINEFWQARDYVHGAGNVRAAVFAVHGLNDDNVTMDQLGAWWEALAAHDVPRKLWLSQLGHVDPFDFRRAEWVTTLHRWFDHWLHGVDNGIMNEPIATVETAHGVYTDEPDWPAPGAEAVEVYLTSADPAEAGALRLRPGSTSDTLTFANTATRPSETAHMNPHGLQRDRLLFLSDPLETDLRISGTPQVEISAALGVETQSNLGVLLVDYGGVMRPDRVGSGLVLGGAESCWGQSSVYDDACYHDVVPRLTPTATPWRVSRGMLDSSNRESLIAGLATPVELDAFYEFAWPLMPHDYTFVAGHRIGVVLTSDLHVVAGTQGATITVDVQVSKIVLPVVGGLAAAHSSGALGPAPTWTPSSDLGGHGLPIEPKAFPDAAAPGAPAQPSEAGWALDGWFTDTAEASLDEQPRNTPGPRPASWVSAGWFADAAGSVAFDVDVTLTGDVTDYAGRAAATTTGAGPPTIALLGAAVCLVGVVLVPRRRVRLS